MSLLTLIKPIIGKPDSTEDVKINNALAAIENWANGNIDSTNLKGQGVEASAIKLLTITAALIAEGTITEAKLAKALQEKLAEKGTGLVLTNKYAAEVEVEVKNPSKIIKLTPSASQPSILFARSNSGGPIFIRVEGVIVGRANAEGAGTAVAWLNPGVTGEITTEPAASDKAIYTVIVV